jgi:hypothetical protein
MALRGRVQREKGGWGVRADRIEEGDAGRMLPVESRS